MLVTNVGTVSGQITTVRGYGGTAPANLADDQVLHILGNAALKGDDAPAACFTSRARKGSWTQVFTAAVRVCRSDLADRKLVWPTNWTSSRASGCANCSATWRQRR